MGYTIEAKFQNGYPALQIADAETRQLKVLWQYDPEHDSPQAALQRLFRALALLSCKDNFSMIARDPMSALDDICLSCDKCVHEYDEPRVNPL